MWRKGQYAQSVPPLKRAIERDSEFALANVQLGTSYTFRPTWLRGQAYLQAKNGALAAAEFQRIIEHRGWDVLSPLWPLAHGTRAERLQVFEAVC